MVNRPPNRRRTLHPRQPPAGACGFCEQPWTVDRWIDGTCVPFTIRGLPRVAHSWPDSLLEDPPPGVDGHTPCGYCGTPVGGYHHFECSLEVCPWTTTHPDDGEQLLFCGCLEDGPDDPS